MTNPKSSVQSGSLVEHRSICQETGLFKAEIDEIWRYMVRSVRSVLEPWRRSKVLIRCRKVWWNNLVVPTIPTIQCYVEQFTPHKSSHVFNLFGIRYCNNVSTVGNGELKLYTTIINYKEYPKNKQNSLKIIDQQRSDLGIAQIAAEPHTAHIQNRQRLQCARLPYLLWWRRVKTCKRMLGLSTETGSNTNSHSFLKK